MFDFPPALLKLVAIHQKRTIKLFQQQCLAVNDKGISVYGPNDPSAIRTPRGTGRAGMESTQGKPTDGSSETKQGQSLASTSAAGSQDLGQDGAQWPSLHPNADDFDEGEQRTQVSPYKGGPFFEGESGFGVDRMENRNPPQAACIQRDKSQFTD